MRNALRLLVACLAVAWLTGCATLPPPNAAWKWLQPGPPSDGDRTSYNLSVYDTAWDWVHRRYYDPTFQGVDWRAARERHRSRAASARDDRELYAAIDALLGELRDRHTEAMSRSQFDQVFRRRNVVVGLRTKPIPGAEDGRRRVSEVLPGGSAQAAGVRVGWVLLRTDGRPPAEVLGPGKLEEGRVVRCEFLTEAGETRTLDLAGRRMAVPPYRVAQLLPSGVLLLQFEEFDLPSSRWMEEQIRHHPEMKGLIVDLRGNGGGHLFALASILGHVFEKPVDLGQMVHRGRPVRWHRHLSQRGGARYRGPVAVLVSPVTASAAEIFAQIIQDTQRGPVVGQTSAGATLTSVFWPLPGGGRLQLSVYDYRSPSGRRLEGQGVVPDVEVRNPEAPVSEADDPVIKAAVERLLEQRASGPMLSRSYRGWLLRSSSFVMGQSPSAFLLSPASRLDLSRADG